MDDRGARGSLRALLSCEDPFNSIGNFSMSKDFFSNFSTGVPSLFRYFNRLNKSYHPLFDAIRVACALQCTVARTATEQWILFRSA